MFDGTLGVPPSKASERSSVAGAPLARTRESTVVGQRFTQEAGQNMNRRLGRYKHTAGAVFTLVASAVLVGAGPAASPPPTTIPAPPEAKLLQNPVKNDGNTVPRGKALFQQHCVPCHGVTGAGDGPMAKKMGYKPANLTLESMSKYVDGELFWRISKGVDPMPAFEKELSARERWDLVSYIRTLVREIQ